ncbi:MAG: SPOR domain-containing protein [Phreatobacter sp.]|nr:SPOR domain-containing protein [Phreatobacter sp.]
MRSYRDYDAYDRDARDREPAAAGRQGGDPLADLARIMGQDDTYADLLKSIARTRTEPGFEAPAAEAAVEDEAADEVEDETYDLPAMPLRGASSDDGIDWEDLEAELAKHREAAADDEVAEEPIDELRGSHELWHGESAAHDELDRRLHEEFGRSFSAADESGRIPAGAYVAAGAAAAVAVGAGAYALRQNQQAGRQEAYAPAPSYAAPAEAAPAASDGRYAYADEADEAPPRRRRAGVTAIVAIMGLAVLGGGGVYGYRAMTGGGGVGGEPRVIRADQSPVRVAAQQAQDPKPVTDRVAQGERVVAREERPVSAREQAAQVQEPPVPARIIPLVPSPDASARAAAVAAPAPVAAPMPAPVPAARAEEPRRVRTVQVGPDGSIMAPAAALAPRPSETSLSVVPVSTAPAAPSRLAAADSRPAAAPVSAGTPMPPPRPVQTIRVARAEPAASPTSVEPVRAAAPAPTAQARPMDLGPQQTASVRAAATAPSPAPAAIAGSGGTFVQISSHQSEAEARSAFATAQRRFPLLQGQSLSIRSAELPGRGTWHRVRVGPFSRAEAQSFCEQLRGSGGSCVLN